MGYNVDYTIFQGKWPYCVKKHPTLTGFYMSVKSTTVIASYYFKFTTITISSFLLSLISQKGYIIPSISSLFIFLSNLPSGKFYMSNKNKPSSAIAINKTVSFLIKS